MTKQRKPQSCIKTLSERYWALQDTRSHNMLDSIQRKWTTVEKAATRNGDFLKEIALYDQDYLLAVMKSVHGGIGVGEAVARLRE